MSSTTSEGAVQGDDSIQARTKDGQQVFIDASVIYAVDPTQIDSTAYQLAKPLRRKRGASCVARGDPQCGFAIWCGGTCQHQARRIGNSDPHRRSKQNCKPITSSCLISCCAISALAMSMPRLSNKSRSQNSRRSKPSSLLSQKKQEAEQARQTAQGQADAAVIASKGAAEARLIQAQAEAKANRVAFTISHTHLAAISIYFETRSRRADHLYPKRQSVHFAAA